MTSIITLVMSWSICRPLRQWRTGGVDARLDTSLRMLVHYIKIKQGCSRSFQFVGLHGQCECACTGPTRLASLVSKMICDVLVVRTTALKKSQYTMRKHEAWRPYWWLTLSFSQSIGLLISNFNICWNVTTMVVTRKIYNTVISLVSLS